MSEKSNSAWVFQLQRVVAFSTFLVRKKWKEEFHILHHDILKLIFQYRPK